MRAVRGATVSCDHATVMLVLAKPDATVRGGSREPVSARMGGFSFGRVSTITSVLEVSDLAFQR